MPDIFPYGDVDLSFEGETPVPDDGSADDQPSAQGEEAEPLERPGARSTPSANAQGASKGLSCGASGSAEISLKPVFDHSAEAGAAWIPFGGTAAYFNGRVEVGGAARLNVSAGASCNLGYHINGPTLGVQVVQVGPVTVVYTLGSGVDVHLDASTKAAVTVEGRVTGGVEMPSSTTSSQSSSDRPPTSPR